MKYKALITAISEAHAAAQRGAAGAINCHLILRNWLIGAYLVEFAQHGEDRAKYGASLLESVSRDLRRRGISGVSPDVLERMRSFFLVYPQLRQHFSATLSRKLPSTSGVSQWDTSARSSRKSARRLPTPLTANSLLRFSWSHFVELIRLDDPWKRAFYENECLEGGWSVRQSWTPQSGGRSTPSKISAHASTTRT